MAATSFDLGPREVESDPQSVHWTGFAGAVTAAEAGAGTGAGAGAGSAGASVAMDRRCCFASCRAFLAASFCFFA